MEDAAGPMATRAYGFRISYDSRTVQLPNTPQIPSLEQTDAPKLWRALSSLAPKTPRSSIVLSPWGVYYIPTLTSTCGLSSYLEPLGACLKERLTEGAIGRAPAAPRDMGGRASSGN